jgi:hypothetical protein
MKLNASKFIVGLALLGFAAPAPAQVTWLAAWGSYNSATQTFPSAANVFDPSVSSAYLSYVGLSTRNGTEVW